MIADRIATELCRNQYRSYAYASIALLVLSNSNLEGSHHDVPSLKESVLIMRAERDRACETGCGSADTELTVLLFKLLPLVLRAHHDDEETETVEGIESDSTVVCLMLFSSVSFQPPPIRSLPLAFRTTQLRVFFVTSHISCYL
jgi:hypothetical protein